MGQKVSPHGLRVGVIKDWDSKWFVEKKKFSSLLYEDYKLRSFLKRELYASGIAKIVIERGENYVKIYINCSKPGIAIGKGGVGIEKIKEQLKKLTDKNIAINIVEVKNQFKNAQLIAENIANQLEKRISFRRAMKTSIKKAIETGVKGIKTQVSGRLGGAEIARTERYIEGNIPLQTLRAYIDYGFAEAQTSYGKIGVKVWVFQGEVLKSETGDMLEEKETKTKTTNSNSFSNRRTHRANNMKRQ